MSFIDREGKRRFPTPSHPIVPNSFGNSSGGSLDNAALQEFTASVAGLSEAVDKLAAEDLSQGSDPIIASHSLKPLQKKLTSAFTVGNLGSSSTFNVDSTNDLVVNDTFILTQWSADKAPQKIAAYRIVSVPNASQIVASRYEFLGRYGADTGEEFAIDSEITSQLRLPTGPVGKTITSFDISASYNPLMLFESGLFQTAKDTLEHDIPLAWMAFYNGEGIDLTERTGTPIMNGTRLIFSDGEDISSVRILGATSIDYAPIVEINYRGVTA